MNSITDRLSTKEKVSYGLGDTASNIVFQVVINFGLYFYTDVFGLEAATVATLMLVVRLFDGVTDPIMGAIADRTKTRWGRYRPYLLFGAIPYGLLAVIAFSTPDTDANNKLVYAYVTYAALMTLYTMLNLPYSALGGVITSNIKERTSVQSFRFALAMVGGAIVASSLPWLVKTFGGGDEAQGYQIAMSILAVFAVICFILCFLGTKERVQDTKMKASAADVWDDLKSLCTNSQYLIAVAIGFIMLVAVIMRASVTPYYVIYFFEQEDKLSLFMTTGMFAGVAGALLMGKLVEFYDKMAVFKICSVLVLIIHVVMLMLSPEHFYIAMVLAALANFFHTMITVAMFAMVPDTVDIKVAETGKRPMAMSYSGHLLSLKIGIAVGGFLAAKMLAYYGYVANAEQTERALNGIVYIYTTGPIVASALAILLLVTGYYITDKKVQDNSDKLAQENT